MRGRDVRTFLFTRKLMSPSPRILLPWAKSRRMASSSCLLVTCHCFTLVVHVVMWFKVIWLVRVALGKLDFLFIKLVFSVHWFCLAFNFLTPDKYSDWPTTWNGFNRPCVARAVLQSPLSVIDSLIKWSFSSESSRHFTSQTVNAREMKFWENVHSPPSVTCHMSGVSCQVPCVRRPVSQFLFGQSGGASRWRVCYQLGLPRLVKLILQNRWASQ